MSENEKSVLGPPTSSEEDPCALCGNEVHSGFTICAHCGAHQVPWKRGLRAFLALFSGFSIVLTAITLLVSFYPQAKRTLFYEEDLELVSVNTTVSGSPGTLSFVNKGDGDVFLSELVIRLKDYDVPLEVRLPIHEIIHKDELRGMRIGSRRASSNTYTDTVGPDEFDSWLSARTDDEIIDQVSTCFLMKPFDRTNGAFLISRSVPSLPARAIISFYSPDKREVRTLTSKTEIHTLLFRKGTSQCST